MARPLRIEFHGAVYSVTSRGNPRQEIVVDDRDRTQYPPRACHRSLRVALLCLLGVDAATVSRRLKQADQTIV